MYQRAFLIEVHFATVCIRAAEAEVRHEGFNTYQI